MRTISEVGTGSKVEVLDGHVRVCSAVSCGFLGSQWQWRTCNCTSEILHAFYQTHDQRQPRCDYIAQRIEGHLNGIHARCANVKSLDGDRFVAGDHNGYSSWRVTLLLILCMNVHSR
jgi:hypothetical protein